MCGRFTQISDRAELADYFGFGGGFDAPPRWNVAPGTEVTAVREQDDTRRMVSLRWGLVPAWAKDDSRGAGTFNARAETAATKPSFRQAFRQRRCLIPADGFFEWQVTGKDKQPWYIHRLDEAPLALAGLWDSWQRADGSMLESCTILTTAANIDLGPIHHRMPVILGPECFEPWLAPATGLDLLQSYLRPCRAGLLQSYRVGDTVNRAGNEGPECVAPWSEVAPEQGDLFS